MKQILSIRANIFGVETPEGVRPIHEIVMIAFEKDYSVDVTSDVVSAKRVEVFRFAASPESLRQMADVFIKYADEAEASVFGKKEVGA